MNDAKAQLIKQKPATVFRNWMNECHQWGGFGSILYIRLHVSTLVHLPIHLDPHYCDVIMGAMVSQITNLTIVYSTVHSRRRSKKTSRLIVTSLYAGNSPVTVEFSAKMASNAENVSIWWYLHVKNTLFVKQNIGIQESLYRQFYSWFKYEE